MSIGACSFSIGNSLWEKIQLKFSRAYTHKCVEKLNASFDDLRKLSLKGSQRIDNESILTARRFFKIVNSKFKKNDEKVINCWNRYRAAVLGISFECYQSSAKFPAFSSKFPIERYLAEHNHELKEIDGKLQILFEGTYRDWSDVSSACDKFIKPVADTLGTPVLTWSYGASGVQNKDMYGWKEFEPYKKEDPRDWGSTYIFEYCVSCTETRLRTSGDHSWFRLKDPEGNVYSVGKNLAAKMEKGLKGLMFPFRVKKGFLMSPDVSEYWPQQIHRLPVEITKEAFDQIIESVNNDKKQESQITFQVFNKNCQEYVNEKALLAGFQIPTSRSVVRLLFPQFIQNVYDRIEPKLHALARKVLHAIGSFFINGLLAILGNGVVDKDLKAKNVPSIPHLKAKDILKKKKLAFHPPTYVAQHVFPDILAWRGSDENKKYKLPSSYYLESNKQPKKGEVSMTTAVSQAPVATESPTLVKVKEFFKHPVVKGVVVTSLIGGIAFGGGMIITTIGKLSPLFAVVQGVQAALITAATFVVEKVGEKKGLAPHKITLINIAISTVIAVAGIVTLAALGIIGPVGIGVLSGLAALVALTSLVQTMVQYKAQKALEAKANGGETPEDVRETAEEVAEEAKDFADDAAEAKKLEQDAAIKAKAETDSAEVERLENEAKAAAAKEKTIVEASAEEESKTKEAGIEAEAKIKQAEIEANAKKALAESEETEKKAKAAAEATQAEALAHAKREEAEARARLLELGSSMAATEKTDDLEVAKEALDATKATMGGSTHTKSTFVPAADDISTK
jgi:hypothetical protein